MLEIKLRNRSSELADLLSASLHRRPVSSTVYGFDRYDLCALYGYNYDDLTENERRYLDDLFDANVAGDDLPFDDDFDDEDDDDMDVIWPRRYDCRRKGVKRKRFNRKRGEMVYDSSSGSSVNKGGKRVVKKRLKIDDDMIGDRVDPMVEPVVRVYFYPDYLNKYDRVEFKGLMEFDEFCRQEGYQLSNDTLWKLFDLGCCHCCLDPEKRAEGSLEIVCESSYERLCYEVCTSDELSYSI